MTSAMAMRFQYSLRLFTAVIAAVCIALAPLAYELEMIRLEDRAGRIVAQAIASSELAERPWRSAGMMDRQRPQSAWRRAMYFIARSPGEVCHISVYAAAPLAVLREQIKRLPHVRWLEMGVCAEYAEFEPLTNDCIFIASRFRHLERLRMLGILSDQVDLSPLQHVEIDELEIDSDVTADVVERLCALNVHELCLNIESPEKGFPAGAFSSMKRFVSLEGLTLHGVIDDEALYQLARAPKLRTLSIGGVTSVTDEGLARAAPLLRVYDLSIGRSAITDRSVETFSRMSDLAFLHLREDTGLSPHGIARLAALRPDMKIGE
jgi:hypothetical protein